MRVRLSVFLLIDEQWRQNLVKKKNKKINISDIRRRLYFMCYLFFVLHILTSLMINLWKKKWQVKVSERGRQGRHKLKTQLNRLLKHWCNCVTESTCIHFVYSKFIPSPKTVHHTRNEGYIERVVKFKLTAFFGGCLNWKMSILVNHSCVYLIVLQR